MNTKTANNQKYLARAKLWHLNQAGSGIMALKKYCEENRIPRSTLYYWKKKIKDSQNPIVSLKDQSKNEPRNRTAGFHPRQATAAQINAVLTTVKRYPEASVPKILSLLPMVENKPIIGYKGVQNILQRYSLRYEKDRLAFAQLHQGELEQPITVAAPQAQVEPTFRISPQHLAAPPPDLAQPHLLSTNVTSQVSSRVFLFTATLILTFVIGAITTTAIFTLLQARSGGEMLGLTLSFLALFCGSIFFIYSLKYYITLALVLLFSRKIGNETIITEATSQNQLFPNKNSNQSTKVIANKISALGLTSDISQVILDRHPFVSIHLPLYNEKLVVNRLLEAVTSFDYDNYEVVVIDDSTDETKDIVNEWRNHAKVKILHRDNRQGFKGGALAEAVKLMDPRTEFVLVFDADFLPYPDTITQFLKYFQTKSPLGDLSNLGNVAAVQGYQWHVLNKSENWITRGVRSEYAGSYVIERSGNEIYHGLKQIAGSVFAIRADLLKAYGWGTSITEDFELTLRLYKAGYKVIYTPYIQAPSECVSTLKRLIRQRMRWAEGHSHNIKKYFFEVLFGKWVNTSVISSAARDLAKRKNTFTQAGLDFSPSLQTGVRNDKEGVWLASRLTNSEKLEFLYLSPYYLQSFFFILGTFSWFLSETVFKVRLPFWTQVSGWSLVLTNLLSLPLMNAVGLFLEESEEKDYAGIPAFILLSYILAPFQAYASVKGFWEKEEGPWFRTPKTGKITDVYKRGKFYRWLTGIIGQTTVVTKGAIKSVGLKADLPLNKKKIRWVGNATLNILILIVCSLVALAPAMPATMQTAKAEERDKVITPSTPAPAKETIDSQLMVAGLGGQVIFHAQPRVRLQKDRMEVEMTLLSINDETVDTTGYRQGPLVVYPEVVNGVNLHYGVGPETLSEEFYLEFYQPTVVIEERLKLTGLKLLNNATGTIYFVPSAGGNPVFTIAPPFMYEKANPDNKTFGLVYEVVPDGQSYIFRKRLTQEAQNWLADPDRQFPVVIDPYFTSNVIASGATNGDTQQGTTQRKIAYMPNATGGAAWYTFHADGGIIQYKKCFLSSVCDGDADWSSNVNVDGGDTGDNGPTVWVSGDKLWISWIDPDDGVDAVEFRNLDTTSDTLGTKCTSSSQGNELSTGFISFIAVGSNGDVVTGYSDLLNGTIRDMWEIATGTCTFSSIFSGSGVPAAGTNTTIVPLALVNKIHLLYDDGPNTINHSIIDVSNSAWDTTDNAADNGNTLGNGQFSAVTDGSSIWMLYFDSSTTTALQKCASTCTTTWSNLTAPWTSGLTTADSPTISYLSTDSKLWACLADGSSSTTQDIKCKSTDATTISWVDQGSVGFTSANYSNVSSVMSAATEANFALVARDGTNSVYSFATVPENLWLVLILLPVFSKFTTRFNKKKSS